MNKATRQRLLMTVLVVLVAILVMIVSLRVGLYKREMKAHMDITVEDRVAPVPSVL